ncbi:MAG: hypothetical protein FJW56_01070 [Actinobacteria bacterium]|nr:hypothetical protein [Actinomycetota bacterium]
MNHWQGEGIPFGYTYNHEKNILEINPHENRILQEIFSLTSKVKGLIQSHLILETSEIKVILMKTN